MNNSLLRVSPRLPFFAVAASVAFATAAHADLTTIDDFNSSYLNGGIGWSVDLGSDTGLPGDVSDNEIVFEDSLAGVIGGSRWINTITTPTQLSTGEWVNYGVSGDLITSSGADYDGIYALSTAWGGLGSTQFRYDADGAGLGIAMDASGVIGLDLYADHFGNGRDTVISMTISDGVTSYTSQMIWDEYLGIQDWITIEFSLTDFANAGVDLDNVYSIEMEYVGDHANDMALDRIYGDVLIPAPSALALLGIGFSSFGGRKRRRF